MDERRRKLFVGIALDDAARVECAAALERLRGTGFAARYEAAEKLHITLAFLGYVPATRYDEVAAAVAAIPTACASFSIALDKLGAFPNERRPRIAFIGARDQGPSFRALAQRVRDAYRALGFDFKDDPVAHVTIARIKAPRRPLPLVEFAPIELCVDALTLFESLPDKANNTSRYESLARVVLTPGRANGV